MIILNGKIKAMFQTTNQVQIIAPYLPTETSTLAAGSPSYLHQGTESSPVKPRSKSSKPPAGAAIGGAAATAAATGATGAPVAVTELEWKNGGK